MVNCPSCGTRNRDNARFCDGCGGRLGQAQQVSVNVQVMNDPRRTRVNLRDPNVIAEIEQLRRVLNSTIESMNRYEYAINRLRELRDMGYSKAGQVLLWYSGYSFGNPRLQRLATS